MTADQLSRLFQRGVQFNANELQAGKGSGLGLYIPKGTCEQHCGSLTPASDGLGKGTSFTITIPLHHVPDTALPKHGRRSSPVTPVQKALPEKQSPGSSCIRVGMPEPVFPGKDDQLRILVVDDAAMNRKLLVRFDD
jgi:hypothetical protein